METDKTLYGVLEQTIADREIPNKWNQVVERIVREVSTLLHPEDAKLTEMGLAMIGRVIQSTGNLNVKQEKAKVGIVGLVYSDDASGENLILRIPGLREDKDAVDAYWLVYNCTRDQITAPHNLSIQ